MDVGHYLEESQQELVVLVMELLEQVQAILADQHYHENLQGILLVATYLKKLERKNEG